MRDRPSLLITGPIRNFAAFSNPINITRTPRTEEAFLDRQPLRTPHRKSRVAPGAPRSARNSEWWPAGADPAFITHDGRMQTCAARREQVQSERYTRYATEAQPPATIACAQCGQRVSAPRRTRMYCSRACQQKAYRERCQASQFPRRPRSS